MSNSRQRQRFLEADAEEDLIALQERMKMTGELPSASVTRVKRAVKASQPSEASPLPPAAASADTAAASAVMQAMQQIMKDTVSEVRERPQPSQQPPSLPLLPHDSSAPFPKAVHRKLSKFSLGRKKSQPQEAAAGPSTAALQQQPPPPPRQSTVRFHEPLSSSSQSDAEAIDAQNAGVLATMTPEQVEEARAEVLSRLPPSAVEFLKKRGAAKRSSAAAAPAAPSQPATTTIQPAVDTDSSREAHSTVGTSKQQSQQETFNPAAAQPLLPKASPSAERLRFDVAGRALGLKPLEGPSSTATAATAAVVTRDPVRKAEALSLGSVIEEGYTVAEACLLARSTVPQQRAFALRLLSSVLTLAKARFDAPVVPQGKEEEEEDRVVWGDVWRHAVHAVEVPRTLRLALDDASPAVVAAAAEATAALLAPGPAERAALEAAAAHPVIGWPAVPLHLAQRPSPADPWRTATLDLEKFSAVKRKAASGEESEEEGQEEVPRPEELAKVDPLAGLANMQLLERVAFVLRTLRPPGASPALLQLVADVALAGQDAASKVAATPGMLDALSFALEEEEGATRVQALCALRMLCQGSFPAARASHAAGLCSSAVPVLLIQPSQPSAQSNSVPLPALCEALQIWRACAMHGLFLVTMDDAYPSLCRLLTPTYPRFIQQEENLHAALPLWAAARELQLTLAQLNWNAEKAVRMGQPPMVSPACAAAVAKQTIDWLIGLPLSEIIDACAAAAVDAEASNRHAVVVATLSTVSAALFHLSSYFSVAKLAAAAAEAEEEAVKADDGLEALISSNILGTGDAGFPRSLAALLQACLENESIADGTAAILESAACAAAVSLSQLTNALAIESQTNADSPGDLALAPFTSSAVIAVLHLRYAAISASSLLLPWGGDVARSQSALQLSRCIAAAGGGGSAAAAAALHILPPGADDTALRLMAQQLSLRAAQHALESAGGFLESNSQQLGPLAAGLAAAGGAGAHRESLPAKPSPKELSSVLLAGYAATWLGFVQEGSEDEGEAETSAAPPLPPQPFTAAFIVPEGSNLPLPEGWTLSQAPVLPPGSQISAPRSLAVAYALLWALGTSQPEETAPASSLKAATEMLFSSDAAAAMEAEEGDEDAWREPLARWAFAALLQRAMSAAVNTDAAAAPSHESQQTWNGSGLRSFVEHFAATSFGDPLFGAAVAAAMSPAFAPLDAQIEALGVLIESHALGLLPPLDACPGHRQTYLGAVEPTRVAEQTYLQVLTTERLPLESAAVETVFHRLASRIFVVSSDGGGAGSLESRQALLRAAIRRLARAGDGHQAALSALLRWSMAEGRPVDVVDADRLEFIRTACAADGEEGLLQVALDALKN